MSIAHEDVCYETPNEINCDEAIVDATCRSIVWVGGLQAIVLRCRLPGSPVTWPLLYIWALAIANCHKPRVTWFRLGMLGCGSAAVA